MGPRGDKVTCWKVGKEFTPAVGARAEVAVGGRGQVPRPPGAGSCCSHGCPAADGPRPLCPWSRPLQGQMSPRGRGQGSGGAGPDLSTTPPPGPPGSAGAIELLG